MNRLTIRIRWRSGWRAPWILFFLVCLIFALTAAQPAGWASVSEPENTDLPVPIGAKRLFYLTNFSRAANTALTACTPGYHMASLWEIYDASNLVYNYAHPNAYTKADSGLSVPSHWYGWVRTGYDSSAANVAGLGNCGAYTSAAGGDYGTILRLNYNWDTSVSAIAPWEPDTWTCAGIAPVWCVGTWYYFYMPLLVR